MLGWEVALGRGTARDDQLLQERAMVETPEAVDRPVLEPGADRKASTVGEHARRTLEGPCQNTPGSEMKPPREALGPRKGRRKRKSVKIAKTA